MKNILVTVDRKQEASQLLKHALIIAKNFNSKIWIIHVTEPDPR